MQTPLRPPRLFDPARRRARLQRAARIHPAVDFLHRRAAEGLADSLDAIARDFAVVADLSPRAGLFAEVVAGHEAASRLGPVTEAGVELSARAVPGETGLGREEGSVDLIVSVLGLHWANDLPGALVQIRRALKPDGLFLGAMLGAGTLMELRDALTRAELEVTGGAAPRVSPFADSHDLAGLMQRAGFALPVVDADSLMVRYGTPHALIADLRAMGEHGSPEGAAPTLRRRVAARAMELYGRHHAVDDDDARPHVHPRVRASFQTLFLTGWAPAPDQPQPLKPGSVATGFRLAQRPTPKALSLIHISEPTRH